MDDIHPDERGPREGYVDSRGGEKLELANGEMFAVEGCQFG